MSSEKIGRRMPFDVERFVSFSKAVDITDLDWEAARHAGISEDEKKILRYMQDTESHTILYLRDLLSGHTAADPEVTTFLACWVYEETHHGRALDRFMVEVGLEPAKARHANVHGRASLRELATGWVGRLAAQATPHFAAVHMAWGAVNEFVAAMTYTQLARRTENPTLETLLLRLAKDERRHFKFYFDQADRRLRSGGRFAQKLCSTLLGNFWEPVGIGVGEASTVDRVVSLLLSDRRGRREVEALDAMVRDLPGMHGWRVGERWAEDARARFRSSNPEDFARHRLADAGRDAAGTHATRPTRSSSHAETPAESAA